MLQLIRAERRCVYVSSCAPSVMMCTQCRTVHWVHVERGWAWDGGRCWITARLLRPESRLLLHGQRSIGRCTCTSMCNVMVILCSTMGVARTAVDTLHSAVRVLSPGKLSNVKVVQATYSCTGRTRY